MHCIGGHFQSSDYFNWHSCCGKSVFFVFFLIEVMLLSDITYNMCTTLYFYYVYITTCLPPNIEFPPIIIQLTSFTHSSPYTFPSPLVINLYMFFLFGLIFCFCCLYAFFFSTFHVLMISLGICFSLKKYF